MRGNRWWPAVILSACLLVLLTVSVSAVPQDTIQPHGWARIAQPGFGDPTNSAISALAVYKNALYAGTINYTKGASIWRYASGVWKQVAVPGLVSTIYNPSITKMLVFNNRLYVGTAWSGTANTEFNYQVWRYDGTSWESAPVLQTGWPVHGYTAMEVFNNELYVGVFKHPDAASGADIIKSPTGDAGSWVTVMQNGNGDAHAFGITSLKAFNGYLYAVMADQTNGIQVVRSNDGAVWTTIVNNGFGNVRNWDPGGLTEYAGYLYLGVRNDNPNNWTTASSQGGELFRLPATTVDGKDWIAVTKNGFGSTHNVKIEGTAAFNGRLYALTYNVEFGDTPASGMEVWSSPDGSPGSWELDRAGGFASANNITSLWTSASAVYDNMLFVGTSNKDYEQRR